MLTALISNFSAASCAGGAFFGFKPWFYYLKLDGACNVMEFGGPGGGDVSKIGSNLGLIGLAIVDDLLQLAGLVAIAFVIYGGILYVTSQGSPEQTQKAQGTIQNALVGLAIAILATAVVSFLGNKLGA